ncbi:MAG TPA: hypothetical protein VF540_01585 [Segetibacter sp.]|jgi:hypothetical protein
MESEQIRFELIKAVDAPNGWQSVRHLMLKLKKEDSDTVLNGLLEIFFLDNFYDYQAAAGGLLWKLKPQYKRNLGEDIKRTLQNWDVSIEELSWYFAEVVGIERVRSEIESLLTEPLNEEAKQRAKTYLYWLSVENPEEFRNELNQGWNGRLRR